MEAINRAADNANARFEAAYMASLEVARLTVADMANKLAEDGELSCDGYMIDIDEANAAPCFYEFLADNFEYWANAQGEK